MDIVLTYIIWGILFGIIGGLVAIYLFPKIGLMDFPERYNLSREKIPYPGGVMLVIAFFILIFIDVSFAKILLPLTVLAVISFIDDRSPIPASVRLLIQFCCAASLWFSGVSIDFIGNPFAETNIAITPDISFIITVIWIVLLTNATNFLDGLPGLAVGVSGIGFFTLGLLGIIRPELFFDAGHINLTTASFACAGICIGAFWFYYKKKIILGDTGSQTLGFLLAALSIFAGAKIATTLLVLGVSILDALLTILRRIYMKKSPFIGDGNHLHHLLARHLNEKKAVIVLIILSMGLGSIALLSHQLSKFFGILLMITIVTSLWFWLQQQQRHL